MKNRIVYYTLDGSMPTTKSKKYTGPFQTEGKVTVRAIAYRSCNRKKQPCGS